MAQEKQFENKLKTWLKSQGIYPLGTLTSQMEKPPIGYYEKRFSNAFTVAGLPDMSIVVNGKAIEVEIKAEKGKPSIQQALILNQINKSKGVGLLVYPKDFDDFKKELRG